MNTTHSHTSGSPALHLPEAPRARTAPGCACEQSWRSDDTCLRCGHSVPAAIQRAPRDRRSPFDGNPWTRAGVVRALRTHRFFVGRAPTAASWSFEEDGALPSVSTVARLFGSFEAAVRVATQSPRTSS